MNDSSTGSIRLAHLLWWLLGFLLLAMTIGIVAVLLIRPRCVPTIVLWQFALTALGALVGALFGIPRRPRICHALPPCDEPLASAVSQGTEPTLLELHADWLTKLLIGVGLILAHRVPELLSQFAETIAAGLDGSVQAETIAMATILTFLTSGFLLGLLASRAYLLRMAAGSRPGDRT